ncbi:dipeptidyl-peptidase 3 family protein [Arenicella xantha]|uniref:Peptidase M49-like protein n=1 Tax=Arenicella xantha TaxID=644221 RepID=A0A395JK82_9GAMM|nr:Zn-dependent hydrolase [Arenicella xantha]RBP47111.1 peptidase M49-like protein [Arenicella xantha]
MKSLTPLISLLLIGALTSCSNETTSSAPEQTADASTSAAAAPATKPDTEKPSRFDIYSEVELNVDMSALTDQQKEMVALLIDAAKITDDIFWLQVWGDRQPLLDSIDDPKARQFAFYNYGPWDRLDADKPFLADAGPRPEGARFYPEDMSKGEFEAWDQVGKDGLYSIIQRDAEGNLKLVPYTTAYQAQIQEIADLLDQASKLAADQGFANYLTLRAEALRSNDYQASDMAWMENKTNPVELVIGPIETYQDALFGYRAAFETFVLIKDMAWSERLARFAKYMPELQQGLPVPEQYKAEVPGSDADLNAYDMAYCAGDCNSGAKTIAINLPNDEQVQLEKGTRRLQLKNAMRAKFDQILLPIAGELIAPDQRDNITFDAFFANTMFHEVAHGLGIKNTLDGSGTVRQALKEHSSALEEGKADILGLYMIQELRAKGEISEGELMDNYVTFLAGIFRSVRFGASSAHGRANMIRFNYFSQAGAFSRDSDTGTYRVNVAAFEQAVKGLSTKLLTLQGDGDYQTVATFVADNGQVSEQLQADLDRLAAASIPVDIVYKQGKEVLGL